MSNFEIKEKIDRCIYFVFNLISDLMCFFNVKLRYLLRRNKKYKNIHSGERCFIVGTGPSLLSMSQEEINLLSCETVIAVNSFYKTAGFDQVRPKYYALVDNIYWGIYSNAFKEILSKYSDDSPVFITDVRARKYLPDDCDGMLLHAKNYPINSIRHDLTKNLSITMNVVGFSIQAAIFMGFKEIYLLGCDYNSFCHCGNYHCYDDEGEIKDLPQYNLSFYLKYYHLTTEFHYLLAKMANQHNVKIINLTRGSLLDAYPIKSFDSII